MACHQMWNSHTSYVAKENFSFHQTSCSSFFDWKELDSINVDDIIHNRNVNAIEKTLPALTHAPIGGLVNNPVLDNNIRKYLLLAQLGLQFLVFNKKCLEKTLNGLKSIIDTLTKDNAKLVKLVKKKNDEVTTLQKQYEHLQRTPKNVFPCFKCAKHFTSIDFLEDHIRRKHSDPELNVQTPKDDTNLINTIKLELEVKQLKERLNLAEKEIQNQMNKQDYERNFELNVNNDKEREYKEQSFKKVDIGTATSNYVDAFVQVDISLSETNLSMEPLSEKEMVNEAKELESPTHVPERNDSETLSKLNHVLEQQTRLLETCSRNHESALLKDDINMLQQSIRDAFESLRQAIGVREISSIQAVKVDTCKEAGSDFKWEERFKKLENTFALNQERMNEDLEHLNTSYSTKFDVLEQTIRNSTLKKLLHSNHPANTSNDSINTTNDSLSQLERSITIVKPTTVKFKDPNSTNEHINDLSAEQSCIEKKEKRTSVKSAVKTVLSTSCTHKKGRLRTEATNQLDLFTEFQEKLITLGVKSSDQKLNTKTMLRMKSKLGQQRLVRKKSLPEFAGLRAQFNAIAVKTAKERICSKSANTTTNNKNWQNQFEACISNQELTQPRPMETIDEVISISSDSNEKLKHVIGSERRFESQLKLVLESPVRRPSLPANVSLSNSISAPLKRVIFSNLSARSNLETKDDTDASSQETVEQDKLTKHMSVSDLSIH